MNSHLLDIALPGNPNLKLQEVAPDSDDERITHEKNTSFEMIAEDGRWSVTLRPGMNPTAILAMFSLIPREMFWTGRCSGIVSKTEQLLQKLVLSIAWR